MRSGRHASAYIVLHSSLSRPFQPPVSPSSSRPGRSVVLSFVHSLSLSLSLRWISLFLAFIAFRVYHRLLLCPSVSRSIRLRSPRLVLASRLRSSLYVPPRRNTDSIWAAWGKLTRDACSSGSLCWRYYGSHPFSISRLQIQGPPRDLATCTPTIHRRSHPCRFSFDDRNSVPPRSSRRTSCEFVHETLASQRFYFLSHFFLLSFLFVTSSFLILVSLFAAEICREYFPLIDPRGGICRASRQHLQRR